MVLGNIRNNNNNNQIRQNQNKYHHHVTAGLGNGNNKDHEYFQKEEEEMDLKLRLKREKQNDYNKLNAYFDVLHRNREEEEKRMKLMYEHQSQQWNKHEQQQQQQSDNLLFRTFTADNLRKPYYDDDITSPFRPPRPDQSSAIQTTAPSLTGWQICILCLLATSGILVVLFLHVVSIDQTKQQRKLLHLNSHHKKKKSKNSSRNLVALHYQNNQMMMHSTNSNLTPSSRKKKSDEWSEDDDTNINNMRAPAANDVGTSPRGATHAMAYPMGSNPSASNTNGMQVEDDDDNNRAQQQHEQQRIDHQIISGLTGLGQEEDPLFHSTIPQKQKTQGYQMMPYPANTTFTKVNRLHSSCSDIDDTSTTSHSTPVHYKGTHYHHSRRNATTPSPSSKIISPYQRDEFNSRISSPQMSPISPIVPVTHTAVPIFLKSTASISSHSSTSSPRYPPVPPLLAEENTKPIEGMVVRLPSPPSSFSSSDTGLTNEDKQPVRTTTVQGLSAVTSSPKQTSAQVQVPVVEIAPFSTGLRQRRAGNAPESKSNWNNTNIQQDATNNISKLLESTTEAAKPQSFLPFIPNLKEESSPDVMEKKKAHVASMLPPPPQTMEEIQKYSKATTATKSLISVPSSSYSNNSAKNTNSGSEGGSFTEDWNLKLPPSPSNSKASANTNKSDTNQSNQNNRKSPSKTTTTSTTSTLSNSTISIAFEDLSLQEVIGSGGFGQVYKAIWKGTPVAVKVLSSHSTTSSQDQEKLQQKQLQNQLLAEFAAEIHMLSGMRHPNICLYIGACMKPPNRAIITELAINGSLWDALRKPLYTPLYKEVSSSSKLEELWPNLSPHTEKPHLGTWPWNLIHKISSGAARGMMYLHSSNPIVLHRDLKSANLLLDESYNVKVADFGLSRFKVSSSRKGSKMTGNCGTIQWMSPEVLSNQRYAEPADVYSYGIILWELLSKQCPYEGMNPIQCAMAVLNKGLRPEIPPWCPDKFRSLIERCTDQDPTLRPTFEEVLSSLDNMVYS